MEILCIRNRIKKPKIIKRKQKKKTSKELKDNLRKVIKKIHKMSEINKGFSPE